MKLRSSLQTSALIAIVAGSSLVAATEPPDSVQVSLYMQEARLHAAQVVGDLELLRTYSMAGVPWQVHFARLQKVEDEVLALATDTQQLYALSDRATTDQLYAMDRVEQLTKSLAVRVKESLRYLNYHSATVDMPAFTNRVNSEYASAKEIMRILCECRARVNKNAFQVASGVREPIAAPERVKQVFATAP